MIVWMLTGLWHGASWNFVLWGLLYAVFLILEKLFLGKWLDKHKGIATGYVLLIVCLGFVLFDASSLTEAISYLKEMFFLGTAPIVSTEFFYYLRSYALVLLLAMVGATPLPATLWKRVTSHFTQKTSCALFATLEALFLCTLLLIVTAFLVDGSYNPFLYFRF